MKTALNIIIVVLFIILVLVLGIPIYQRSQPSKIKIVCEPTVSSLPVLIAEEQGIFKERKVEPEITFEENPGKIFKMLSEGRADVVVAPWIEAIKWIAEHKDTLKCFFSVEFKTCDGLITKRKIRFLKDLNKKTVLTSPLYKTAVEVMNKGANISLKPVFVSFKDMADKIKNYDAVILVEPYLSLYKDKGILFESPTFAKRISAPFPGSGIFIKKSYFEKNKLAVIRFKEALDIAYLYMQREKDSVPVFIKRKFNIPSQIADSVRLPNYLRVHEIDKTGIQLLADRLYGYGVIKNRVDITPLIIPVADLRR